MYTLQIYFYSFKKRKLLWWLNFLPPFFTSMLFSLNTSKQARGLLHPLYLIAA